MLNHCCKRSFFPKPALCWTDLAHQMKRNSLTHLQWKKKVVWPYHRRHLDLAERSFTCFSLPFTAVSMFAHTHTHKWCRCTPVVKTFVQRVLMWCFTQDQTPEMMGHVVSCKVFPPLLVTHSHFLTDTTYNKCQAWAPCVCVCVCPRVLDVRPLTGMEAACWTNRLTNVSTFPPSLSKLTPMNCAERRGMEKREKGGKKSRGVVWQAADPLLLPSDSVYLPLAPWGFVSEDGAMMNRPV